MVTGPCKLGRIFLYLLVAHDKIKMLKRNWSGDWGLITPDDMTLTICDVKALHVTIRTKCKVYLNSDEPEMARPCEEEDIVKRILKRKNILLDSWRQRAKKRTSCRNLIKT